MIWKFILDDGYHHIDSRVCLLTCFEIHFALCTLVRSANQKTGVSVDDSTVLTDCGTELYWTVLNCTELYWTVLKCTEMYCRYLWLGKQDTHKTVQIVNRLVEAARCDRLCSSRQLFLSSLISSLISAHQRWRAIVIKSQRSITQELIVGSYVFNHFRHDNTTTPVCIGRFAAKSSHHQLPNRYFLTTPLLKRGRNKLTQV